MLPTMLIGTILLAVTMVSVAQAKIVPVFEEQCPCEWRTSDAEWANHAEFVQCAKMVMATGVEASRLTPREAARQLRLARNLPCAGGRSRGAIRAGVRRDEGTPSPTGVSARSVTPRARARGSARRVRNG